MMMPSKLNRFSTCQMMLLGLCFAVLVNLPFYAWIFAKDWPLISGFPVALLGAGMVYMATFFHEIGHTVFMWFYGYPTVPVFDFKYGGGMAQALSGQQIPLLVVIWGSMGYGLWLFRETRFFQSAIIALFLLNVAMAFNHYHAVVIDFMGPAAECIVAAFLLYRALFDVAPRGEFERFLNAFFGFGMIVQVFINGYGLMYNNAYRLLYYEQKGSHGFGDFHKIADKLTFLDFQGVVIVWLVLNLVCLILPFVLYVRKRAADL